MLSLYKSIRTPLGKIWRTRPVRRIRLYALREARNAQLKDRHLGSRAFIIGNGPSILKQDLTRLRGEVTFVLNSFFHHPEFHVISPTYLCSTDPTLIEVERRQAWYQLHQQKDTRKTTMLFAKAAQKVDRKYGLFGEHQVYYVHAASKVFPPLSSLTYCPTDLTRPLAGHGLVFIDVALLAAFYMGAQRIYLTGFDAGPVTSFDDYVNRNFYGKDPLMSMEKYRKNYDFFFVQKEFSQSRAGLYGRTVECIKRTFARRGVEILNATLGGGNLPGFAHVDFEDITSRPAT
jgi:hypothetical protein